MAGPNNYDDLPMNWIGNWTGRRAALTPSREALYDVGADRRFTYGELEERANRVGAFLVDELGLKKGDKICFIARNRIEIVDLYFACGKTGIILAPLSYRLAPRELNDLLQRIQPQAFFYEDVFAELANGLGYPESVAERIEIADGDCEFNRRALVHEPRDVNVPLAMSDIFLYIHTGGTTATPKVCVIPYRQMVWNSLDIMVTGGGLGQSRELVTFPFFHIGGWNSFTPLIHAGAFAVLLRQFDPKLLLELIEREKVTHFGGVEAMLQFVLAQPEFEKTDLSSLEGITTAGAPCAAHVMKPFHDRGIPISQAYGLTEAGPSNFTYTAQDADMDEVWRHNGSIGTSMFHCDYKIIDQDSHKPVSTGEVGVLCMRSLHNFQEYLHQEERTASTFLEDGWVYSGDLAREDDEGFVYIVGRADNMFISGGENVSPEEIENVLLEYPAIEQAAVIAVPDEKWGQAPLAVVVSSQGTGIADEVLAHCKKHLARFKVPKAVEFIDALPVTGAGKIDRNTLKANYG